MMDAKSIRSMENLHPVDQLGIFIAFELNVPAFYYFGIICFHDLPGYFPQLDSEFYDEI